MGLNENNMVLDNDYAASEGHHHKQQGHYITITNLITYNSHPITTGPIKGHHSRWQPLLPRAILGRPQKPGLQRSQRRPPTPGLQAHLWVTGSH